MNRSSYEQPSRLATKLRQEYRNRGEELQGIGAASTEELMRRAQMGRDPRENVSEEVFSERIRNRQQTASHAAYRYRATAHTAHSAYGNGSSGAGTPRATHAASSSAKPKAKSQKQPKKQSLLQKLRKQHDGEVRVQGYGFPVGYLAMLAAVTLMIMGILISISQVYQTTGTIADLEDELVTLQAEIDKLELAIEEKNDIRVIEQIATDQLGMVKEDSVQRKYVSLSDGERIDIIEDDEDTVEQGTLGTMLSSLAEAFAGFFESLGD